MRAVALLGALLLSGCTASPLRPSDPTYPLTVIVLTQATHAPIPEAAVWLNGAPVARTDQAGAAHLTIAQQSAPLIWATAAGFQESVHYHDVLSGPTEQWTFYLWP